MGDGVNGVGAVHTGIRKDSVGVGHGADGAVDQGGVGFPLPAAGDHGALDVGADADVGGVGHAERSVGDSVRSSSVGDGMCTDSIGVGTDESSGVDQGRVGFGLSLPLAVVGNGVVGIGVGRVDMGGSNRSDGGVGDHSDVVGASVLDRLGNVGSCGNLANSPGLSLGTGEMIFYLF